RLWVTTAFLPNIPAMRGLVLTHADLLSEPVMPPLPLKLCAHVPGYEMTVARWSQSGYGEHLSAVPFPSQETATYARMGFTEPKREQARLLGQRHGG
ncbi:hypothetical protein JGS43_38950, partial [Streptomyces sp. P01-F02]|nr:hypothetical protein [Streptomyces poriferorum]